MIPALLAIAFCLSPAQDPPPERAWAAELDEIVLGSPVVFQDLAIVVTRRGKVSAFKIDTGDPAWVGNADAGVICPPALFKNQLFLPAGPSSSILDPATGKRERASAQGGVRVIAGPSKLFLLAGFTFDGAYFLGASKSVVCLDADTGKYLWTWETAAMEVGAVVEAGPRVYLAGPKQLLVLDARTGKEIKGSTTPTPGLAFHGLADRDHIIFQAKADALACYDSKSLKELWRWSRRPECGPGSIPPTLLGDRLILALLPEVVGLESRTGTERWKRTLEGKPEFSQLPPAVRGKEICIGANGRLFALDSVSGKLQWTLEAAAVDPAHRAHQPVWARDRLLYACGKSLYCFKPK
jgi:outer membrane protein assembly factor BamB